MCGLTSVGRASVLLWAGLVAGCQQEDSAGTDVTVTGSSSTADPTDPTSPTSDAVGGESSTSSGVGTSTGGPGTGTTSTVGETSGGVAAPVCGDGVVDVELGEACDDSYEGNNDFGACTLNCQRGRCGDGLVWVGVEQCDHADDNNDGLYNGCTSQCALGPRCGDGVLQGPEECDYGAGNGTDEMPPNGVSCTQGCRFVGKVVYVSSALYDGDLGGTAGAHLKCQGLAMNAGLDNAVKFRAWISAGAIWPANSFEYGTPEEDVPYVLPDGTRVALDFADLILSGPGDGIVMNEKKEPVLDRMVWTATEADGVPFNPTQDCEGWTSASPGLKGRVGRSGVDKGGMVEWQQWKNEKQWSSFKSRVCDVKNRIYCFEQ